MNSRVASSATFAMMLCAGVSFAQTPATPQQNPKTSPPPTSAPPPNLNRDPVHPVRPPNPANPANPPKPLEPFSPRDPADPLGQGARTAPPMPQIQPFQVLDLDRNGMLTKQQANADPWLMRNFATCDADSNNEVTGSEYASCTRAR